MFGVEENPFLWADRKGGACSRLRVLRLPCTLQWSFFTFLHIATLCSTTNNDDNGGGDGGAQGAHDAVEEHMA
jgi:hypothetical protein